MSTPTTTTKPTTLETILGFIPLIVSALAAAFRINSEVGHVTAAQVVTDSIAAGAAVAQGIPEEHVQIAGALAGALAPTVGAVITAASSQSPTGTPTA